MSTVLNVLHNGIPNNVYLFYNFKQVNDQIMLVMYSDKFKSWKNIFIGYENGSWQTHKLSRYADAETYQQVFSQLKPVFKQHKQPSVNNKKRFKLSTDHALLILNGCS